jgi:hypothetical protein
MVFLDADEGTYCVSSSWGTSPWIVNTTVLSTTNLTITAPSGESIIMALSYSTSANCSWTYPLGPDVGNYFGGINDDLQFGFSPEANQGTSPLHLDVSFNKPIRGLLNDISNIDASGVRADKVTITSDAGNSNSLVIENGSSTTIASNTINSASAKLVDAGGYNSNNDNQ